MTSIDVESVPPDSHSNADQWETLILLNIDVWIFCVRSALNVFRLKIHVRVQTPYRNPLPILASTLNSGPQQDMPLEMLSSKFSINNLHR